MVDLICFNIYMIWDYFMQLTAINSYQLNIYLFGLILLCCVVFSIGLKWVLLTNATYLAILFWSFCFIQVDFWKGKNKQIFAYILTNTSYTVVLIRVGYFVLLNYSYKSWSIIKTRDIFENCWSWRFQNTPYMSNLTKFWLRYLRLKTYETNLLFSWYLIRWRWK